MKRIIIAAALIISCTISFAQDYDFIGDLDDDFTFLDTVPKKKKFFNEHLLGVEYSAIMSGIKSSPSIGESRTFTYRNYGISYTFYHVLWDKMANFGLKIGARYEEVGYKSEYPQFGETYHEVELPLISQFKIDFSAFRILVNAGTYYGYRLDTDKPGGFDQYDQRHDYGLLAGAGFGIVFRPMEFHIEANYKFGLGSIYQTNKISDLYWLYAYPRDLVISAGLYFHLEKRRR